ncbi:hypothetical protein RCH10_005384 [Variovorax sp. GrIS 2.14]
MLSLYEYTNYLLVVQDFIRIPGGSNLGGRQHPKF